MKKLLSIIILTTMLCYGISVNADIIDVNLNSVNVTVDGNRITTPNILWQGTTYIPLRSVSESLKCNVDWDGSTNTAAITRNVTTIDYDLLTMFNAQYKSTQLKRLLKKCETIYDKLSYEYDNNMYGSTTEFNKQTKTQVQALENDIIINNAALKLGYSTDKIQNLTLYISSALDFLNLTDDWLILHSIYPSTDTIEGYRDTRMKALTCISQAHNVLNQFDDDMANYVIKNYSK